MENKRAAIKNALIIGASRGLGLGLVHELAQRGVEVTGTVRDGKRKEALSAELPASVGWHLLDMNDAAGYDGFLRGLSQPRYDVIFINAGVSGPEHQSVTRVNAQELSDLFMTNAVSPLRLAGELIAKLQPKTGILAFMTSIMGSVALNTTGGMDLYRASKAALNSLTRSFVAERGDQHFTTLNIHPGWVATDMGGENAPLSIHESVSGIADVLEASAGLLGHHYLDYQGQELAW